MNDHTSLDVAAVGDIPELVELLGMLFKIEKDYTVDRVKQGRGLRMILSAPDRGTVLVCRERGGPILGMATIQLLVSTAEGGLSAQIEDVIVRPGSRGQGIGSWLLDWCKRWGRDHGAVRMQLAADSRNLRAERFYGRLGWVRSQMGVYYRDLEKEG